MLTDEEIRDLSVKLSTIRADGMTFFEQAEELQGMESEYSDIWDDVLSQELREVGHHLRSRVKRLSVEIAGAARGSPLVAAADLQDLRHNTRQLLASIHFHEYLYHGVCIHHDEGTVLGVDPPSNEEHPVNAVSIARKLFERAAENVADLIDFLVPMEAVQIPSLGTAKYRPNTAFIMMAINRNQPELEDVRNCIKDVCKEFGIVAITADEIEHEGVITDRILEEIESREFLIADLSGERPNVYYEIGHAHARNRRVVLYRRKGTNLHFDVAHRNCPEYNNITDLRQQLRKRLETLTNKPQGG